MSHSTRQALQLAPAQALAHAVLGYVLDAHDDDAGAAVEYRAALAAGLSGGLRADVEATLADLDYK